MTRVRRNKYDLIPFDSNGVEVFVGDIVTYYDMSRRTHTVSALSVKGGVPYLSFEELITSLPACCVTLCSPPCIDRFGHEVKVGDHVIILDIASAGPVEVLDIVEEDSSVLVRVELSTNQQTLVRRQFTKNRFVKYYPPMKKGN